MKTKQSLTSVFGPYTTVVRVAWSGLGYALDAISYHETQQKLNEIDQREREQYLQAYGNDSNTTGYAHSLLDRHDQYSANVHDSDYISSINKATYTGLVNLNENKSIPMSATIVSTALDKYSFLQPIIHFQTNRIIDTSLPLLSPHQKNIEQELIAINSAYSQGNFEEATYRAGALAGYINLGLNGSLQFSPVKDYFIREQEQLVGVKDKINGAVATQGHQTSDRVSHLEYLIGPLNYQVAMQGRAIIDTQNTLRALEDAQMTEEQFMELIGKANEEFREELENFWKKKFSDLKEFYLKPILEQQRMLFSFSLVMQTDIMWIKGYLKKQQSEQEKERKRKEFERSLQAWCGITHSILFFAQKSGDRTFIALARAATIVTDEIVPATIELFGSGGNPILIADGLLKFAVAVFKIIDVFTNKEGPSFQTLVLEDLREIKQMLANQNEKLDAHHFVTLRTIAASTLQIEQCISEVVDIVQLNNKLIDYRLDRFESQLYLLSTRTHAIFDIVWFKKLEKVINELDQFLLRNAGKKPGEHSNSCLVKLDSIKVEHYLEQLAKWLLIQSKDNITTGAFLYSSDLDLLTINKILTEENIENLLGFLYLYVKNKIGVELDVDRVIYNPSIWLKAATSYVNLVLHAEQTIIAKRDPNKQELKSVLQIARSIQQQYTDLQNNDELIHQLFLHYESCCKHLAKCYSQAAHTLLANEFKSGTLQTNLAQANVEKLLAHDRKWVQTMEQIPWDPKIPQNLHHNHKKETTEDWNQILNWNTAIVPGPIASFYQRYYQRLNTHLDKLELPNSDNMPLASFLPYAFDGYTIILPLNAVFSGLNAINLPSQFLLAQRMGLGEFKYSLNIQMLQDYYAVFEIVGQFVSNSGKVYDLFNATLEAQHTYDNDITIINENAISKNKLYGYIANPYNKQAERTTTKLRLINAWLHAVVLHPNLNPYLEYLANELEDEFNKEFNKLRQQVIQNKLQMSSTQPNASNQIVFDHLQAYFNATLEIDNVYQLIKIFTHIRGAADEVKESIKNLFNLERVNKLATDQNLSLDQALNDHVKSYALNETVPHSALVMIRRLYTEDSKIKSSRELLFPLNATHFAINELARMLKKYINEPEELAVAKPIYPNGFIPEPIKEIFHPDLLLSVYDNLLFDEIRLNRYQSKIKKEPREYLSESDAKELTLTVNAESMSVIEYDIRIGRNYVFRALKLDREQVCAILTEIITANNSDNLKFLAGEMISALFINWHLWKEQSQAEKEFYQRYQSLLQENTTWLRKVATTLKKEDEIASIFTAKAIHPIIHLILLKQIDAALHLKDANSSSETFIIEENPVYAAMATIDPETFANQLQQACNFMDEMLNYCSEAANLMHYIDHYLKIDGDSYPGVIAIRQLSLQAFSEQKELKILIWEQTKPSCYQLLNHAYIKYDAGLKLVDNQSITYLDVETGVNLVWCRNYFSQFKFLESPLTIDNNLSAKQKSSQLNTNKGNLQYLPNYIYQCQTPSGATLYSEENFLELTELIAFIHAAFIDPGNKTPLEQANIKKLLDLIAIEVVVSGLRSANEHWRSQTNTSYYYYVYQARLVNDLSLLEKIEQQMIDRGYEVNTNNLPIYLTDAVLAAFVSLHCATPSTVVIDDNKIITWLRRQFPVYEIIFSKLNDQPLRNDLQQQIQHAFNFIVQTINFVTDIFLEVGNVASLYNSRDISIIAVMLISTYRMLKKQSFDILLWYKPSSGPYLLLNKLYRDVNGQLKFVEASNFTEEDREACNHLYWSPTEFCQYSFLNYAALSSASINEEEQVAINHQLLEAAVAGLRAELLSTLAQGGQPFAKNEQGETALAVAAKNGHLDIVKLLLPVTNISKKNASILFDRTHRKLFAHPPQTMEDLHHGMQFALNDSDLSTLMLAVRHNHLEVADYLLFYQQHFELGKGEQFSIRQAQHKLITDESHLGATAVMIAAYYNYSDMLHLLFKRGVNGEYGIEISLAYGCLESEFCDLLIAQLKQKNLPLPSTRKVIDILTAAVIFNNVTVVNHLCRNLYKNYISQGNLFAETTYYKNDNDKLGYTLLMIASENENLAMMRLLLELGSDVNQVILHSGEEITALHLVLESANKENLLFLIQNKAEPLEKDLPLIKVQINTLNQQEIKTFLFAAVQSEILTVIKICLELSLEKEILNAQDISQAMILTKNQTILDYLQKLSASTELTPVIPELDGDLTLQQYQRLQSIGLFDIPKDYKLTYLNGTPASSIIAPVNATIPVTSGAQFRVGHTPVGINGSGATAEFEYTVIKPSSLKITTCAWPAKMSATDFLKATKLDTIPTDFRFVYTQHPKPWLESVNNAVSGSARGRTYGATTSSCDTASFERLQFTATQRPQQLAQNTVLQDGRPSKSALLYQHLTRLGFFAASPGSVIALKSGGSSIIIEKEESVTLITSGNNGQRHGDYFDGATNKFKRTCLVNDNVLAKQTDEAILLKAMFDQPVMSVQEQEMLQHKNRLAAQIKFIRENSISSIGRKIYHMGGELSFPSAANDWLNFNYEAPVTMVDKKTFSIGLLGSAYDATRREILWELGDHLVSAVGNSALLQISYAENCLTVKCTHSAMASDVLRLLEKEGFMITNNIPATQIAKRPAPLAKSIKIINQLLKGQIHLNSLSEETINEILVKIVASGDIANTKWFFVHGCDSDISRKNSEGKTPILAAAENGKLAMLHWLLEQPQASLQDRDNNRNNALHLAAANGHLEVVKFLIEQHAFDLEGKNNQQQTAYDLAPTSEIKELISKCLPPHPYEYKCNIM